MTLPAAPTWEYLHCGLANCLASDTDLQVALANKLRTWIGQCWPDGQRMARAALHQPYLAHRWLATHLLWRHIKRVRPGNALELWKTLVAADSVAIRQLLAVQLAPHLPALQWLSSDALSPFEQAQECARACLNRVSVRLIVPKRYSLAAHVHAALGTHDNKDVHGMKKSSILYVAKVSGFHKAMTFELNPCTGQCRRSSAAGGPGAQQALHQRA